MPVTAVIGGQWGDEGKGKIVDRLCEHMHVVARYQGGANAGHTVNINGHTIILHQIPAGILRPGCRCILGQGMVIDPVALSAELDELAASSIDTRGRIQIGYAAHIVTPLHKIVDKATGHLIGTTLRGIGPAYSDKSRRVGLRAVDLLDLETLRDRLSEHLRHAMNRGEISVEELDRLPDDLETFLQASLRMLPMLADTVISLRHALDQGKNILIEGAQGTLLDLDLGTYPYVTSSHPTVGGICTGLGIPIQKVDRLIGVFKAYNTRVGRGPFPTELEDHLGEQLRTLGSEFGATTGRPRRCGWFDAVAARYSCQLNGFTEIALTKLDVLDPFDTLKICTAYELNGNRIQTFSSAVHRLERAVPIYEELPGWKCETAGFRSIAELPLEAVSYVNRLEELMGVPVATISVGAERNQALMR
jgi:adenylosuccinate synthase